MKICFPVELDKGLESVPYAHFGSAPVFLIFDTETESTNAVANQNLDHSHGMCSPLKALGGEKIDVIFVGGIGAGAVSKLNNMGIRIYEATRGTIRDNIKLFNDKAIKEISIEHACKGHTGGCGH